MNKREVRLQKYIADSGLTSRRNAEKLIAEGKVRVNGYPVTEMGMLVGGHDAVEVNGKRIVFEKEKIYLLLNKPEGYVTTLKDEHGRKTVIDLLPEIKQRVYPVGRLDCSSSGLLILTNDGEFANMIAHPSSEIEKEYLVKLDKPLTEEHFRKIAAGVETGKFFAKPKNVRRISSDANNPYIAITLIEGRNREVREMMETLSYKVQKLKRVRIGNIDMGFLRKGHHRFLSISEITKLKMLCAKTNK